MTNLWGVSKYILFILKKHKIIKYIERSCYIYDRADVKIRYTE